MTYNLRKRTRDEQIFHGLLWTFHTSCNYFCKVIFREQYFYLKELLKTFILSEIMSFQRHLCRYLVCPFIKSSYINLNENTLVLMSFYTNKSGLSNNCCFVFFFWGDVVCFVCPDWSVWAFVRPVLHFLPDQSRSLRVCRPSQEPSMMRIIYSSNLH